MITKLFRFVSPLLIISLYSSLSAFSQAGKEKQEIYFVVDEMPQYPGGDLELYRYFFSQFKMPEECRTNGVKGKLYVRFVIFPDGHVDSVFAVRPIHPLFDAEAIRVVKTLSHWTAGKKNGMPVPVWYSMPINFEVE